MPSHKKPLTFPGRLLFSRISMKLILSIISLSVSFSVWSQAITFPEHLKKTHIAKLKNKDSLVYYQCHVDEATQELTTSSGQKIISGKKKLTITEKFVIHKTDTDYSCKYFTSSVTTRDKYF